MREIDDVVEELADFALGVGKLHGKRFADVAEEFAGGVVDWRDVGILGVD